MAINTSPRSGDFADEVGRQLHDKLHEIIKENNLMKSSESLRKVTGWYDETEQKLAGIPKEQLRYMPDSGEMMDLAYSVKMGRDSFVSTFATLLVKKIVEHANIPFVEMSLDEIRIRTEGKQKQVEIKNFEAKLKPIRPVAEILFQASGIPQTIEVKFQIDANVKIPDMEFYGITQEGEIQIGRLFADFKLSLLEVDVDSKKFNAARPLGEKEFEMDLKGYKFSRLHSKECPHCSTANPAHASYCGECGKAL